MLFIFSENAFFPWMDRLLIQHINVISCLIMGTGWYGALQNDLWSYHESVGFGLNGVILHRDRCGVIVQGAPALGSPLPWPSQFFLALMFSVSPWWVGTRLDLLGDCPLCCFSSVGGLILTHTTLALRALLYRFSEAFKHPWQPISLMKVLLYDTEKREKWVDDGHRDLWGEGKKEGCPTSSGYSGEQIRKYLPHAREIPFKHFSQSHWPTESFPWLLWCSFLGLQHPALCHSLLFAR